MTHWVVAEWMRERVRGWKMYVMEWCCVLLIKMSNCCMWAIRRFSHLLRRTLRTTTSVNLRETRWKQRTNPRGCAFDEINVLSQLSLDRNNFLFCKNSPRDLSPTNLWDRSPHSPSPFPLDPSDCRIKGGRLGANGLDCAQLYVFFFWFL